MQLAQPTARLADAIASLRRFVLTNATSSASCTYEAVLAAARQEDREEKPLDRMVRRALLSMLEERQTRPIGPLAGYPSAGSSGRDLVSR
jgi:hypothetical protein